MRGEGGLLSFFAYTSLFITSMVVLVLADNLLLLMYLGWKAWACALSAVGFHAPIREDDAAAVKRSS